MIFKIFCRFPKSSNFFVVAFVDFDDAVSINVVVDAVLASDESSGCFIVFTYNEKIIIFM